jgi:hypothetical protein
MGLGMFGGLVLQPSPARGLLGYPIVTDGLLMAPRGIATGHHHAGGRPAGGATSTAAGWYWSGSASARSAPGA